MTGSSRQMKISISELTPLVSGIWESLSKNQTTNKNHLFSSSNWGGFSLVLFLYLFFIPTMVSAQVMMTEVMYDLEGTDTGREWVEVYNAGSSPVDLADWKLFEANTNHRLTAQSVSVIPAQGFAIIADNTVKFLADHPAFSGVLFDSAFSLSNEGETLVLRDGSGADIDTVSYTSALGAVGDGQSLQKSGSSWISASPTVGSMTNENTSQVSGVSTSGDTSSTPSSTMSSGSSSSHASQSVASGLADDVTLEVSSGRDRLGFVGTPLSFEAKIKKPRDLASVSVAHSWSMGDGTRKSGQFISHTYVYPGDYVVVLNSEYGGDKAVSKIKVRIVSPQVSIRTANGDFVEIANDSNDELNLGSWVLETQGGRFVIPPDTIIFPRGVVRLPSSATRLRPVGSVRLMNPSLSIVSSRDISGGVPHVTIDERGEPVIAMNGLTEEMIRRQFATASSLPHVENTQRYTDVAVDIPKKESSVNQSIAIATTSTQAASVVYTVGEKSPSRGLFRKIFDFFR